MSDKELVHQAIENHRYNPEILPNLEAYVDYQIANQSYDLDANLAIMKLYQFNPQTTNHAVMAKILAKSLMALPESDFMLCTYLIPNEVEVTDEVLSLIHMNTQLETCNFAGFWAKKAEHAVLKAIPGFDEAVREIVLTALARSHQGLPSATICAMLNCDSAELGKMLVARGWKTEGAQVKFPLSADNQPKQKVSVDGIKYGDVSAMLAGMS